MTSPDAGAVELLHGWRLGRARGDGKTLDIETVRALTALGAVDEALRILDDAETRHPRDFYLGVLRSGCMAAAGDWLAAADLAAEAARLDPGHLAATYDAAVLALRARRFPLASDLLDAALELFMGEAFDPHSPFPLQALLRLYAAFGPASASRVRVWLERLEARGHQAFEELSPRLRQAMVALDDTAHPMRLGQVAADPRSRLVYEGRRPQGGAIAGYGVRLEDHSQHHLRLHGAMVSGSCGAVWSDGVLFALDHGFVSTEAASAYDIEGKTVLVRDEAIASFHLAAGVAHLDAARAGSWRWLDAKVLVAPPCHHVNFGHFVHDVLALKHGLDRLREEDPEIQPLLLRPFASAVFQEAFERTFGTRYLRLDDPHGVWRVREAHLLTLPHAMWPRRGAICIGPVRALLTHLRAGLPPAGPPRRVFVARDSGAPPEGTADLRAAFEAHGFEAVALHRLPPSDYFPLLASATHLAGAHGAGLMNLAFAPTRVRVMECRRPGGNWHSIATFAAAGGVDFQSLDPAAMTAEELHRRIQAWLAGA